MRMMVTMGTGQEPGPGWDDGWFGAARCIRAVRRPWHGTYPLVRESVNSHLVCSTCLSQQARLCAAETSLSGWTPLLGIPHHSYAEDMEISTAAQIQNFSATFRFLCLLLGVL